MINAAGVIRNHTIAYNTAEVWIGTIELTLFPPPFGKFARTFAWHQQSQSSHKL